MKFKREVEFLRILQGKLVPILYGIMEQPLMAIVMEYFVHGTLLDLMTKSSIPFEWEMSLSLAMAVVKAIHTLHSLNPSLIHCNIKSINLLVQNGSQWTIKLADLSMVRLGNEKGPSSTTASNQFFKALIEENTSTMPIHDTYLDIQKTLEEIPLHGSFFDGGLYSFFYLAPEIANLHNGGSLEHNNAPRAPEQASCDGKTHVSATSCASDIYSFAIVLWELITRTLKGYYVRPYSDQPNLKYDYQVILQTTKKNLRPTISTNTPQVLSQVLQQCWTADQKERPSTLKLLSTLRDIKNTLVQKNGKLL